MPRKTTQVRKRACADPGALAYDVPEFCQLHRIGRTFFYNLLRAGQGPRVMKVGDRTLISQEAAREWRARMEDDKSPRNGG